MRRRPSRFSAQPRGPLAAGRRAALGLLALLLAGCPAPGGGGGGGGDGLQGVEPILPEDYRSTFTEVRDCRNSSPHPATMRVWVSEQGADGYVNGDNPLPAGTIVVKESFEGTGCADDGELAFWSVMRKEAAGFDPQAGDWHFQEVESPSRRVTRDGKATCITCHSAADCLVRDFMCTEP